MLNLLLPVLGFLGPLGSILAVLGVLVGSAGTGAYAMHKWDNASYYQAEASAAKKKLHTIQLAQQQDAQAALAANKRADGLQEIIDEVTETVGDGVCFSKPESDSLRKLWRSPVRHHQPLSLGSFRR